MFLEKENIISSTNTNAENQDALLSFLELYSILTSIVVTYSGETVTYQERCNTTASGCLQHSVLSFFDYSASIIQNDPDVLATINNGLTQAAAESNVLLRKDIIFGSPVPEDRATPTVRDVALLMNWTYY